jgi:hypothetical protein
LQGASDAQLQLIFYLIIGKHVAPSETALAYLQIPIITKSKTVTYVDMKLLALRTKIVTNSRVLDFHPIDSYTNRPEEFESIIFIESFTTYKTDRMTRGNAIPITRDNLRYYL